MKNEFEKLDAFMKAHSPGPAEKSPPELKLVHHRGRFLPALVALVLVVLVFRQQLRHEQLNTEELIALSETLDWDVTTDEMPLEFEETLAYVE
jgi:hypothetical protein